MTGGWAATNTLRRYHLELEDQEFDSSCDVCQSLALVQTALEAAEHRVEYSHNDTCDSVLSESEDYPCTCGHDALDAALRAVREGK